VQLSRSFTVPRKGLLKQSMESERDLSLPEGSPEEVGAIQLSATTKSKKRTTQVKVLLNEEELELLDRLVEKNSSDRATVFRNLLTNTTYNIPSNVDSEIENQNNIEKNGFNTVFFDFKDFDEGLPAIDCLKNGQTLVCSIGSVESDMAQRIIDFLAGATSLSNGNAEQINASVFVFSSGSGKLGFYDHKNREIAAYLTSSQKRLLQSRLEVLKLNSGSDHITSKSVEPDRSLASNTSSANSTTFEEFISGSIDCFLEQLSKEALLLLGATREAYSLSSNVQSLSLLLQSIFSEKELSLETLSQQSENLNSIKFEPQMLAESEIIDCVMSGKDLFPQSLIDNLNLFMLQKDIQSPEEAINLILNSMTE